MKFVKDIQDKNTLIRDNRERKDEIRRIIRDQNIVPTLRRVFEEMRKGSDRDSTNIDDILENQYVKEEIEEYILVLKETEDRELILDTIRNIISKILDSVSRITYDAYFNLENMQRINQILCDFERYIRLDDRLAKDFELYPIYSQRERNILGFISVTNLMGAGSFYYLVLSEANRMLTVLFLMWILLLVSLILGYIYCNRKYNFYRSDFESIFERKKQEYSGLRVIS